MYRGTNTRSPCDFSRDGSRIDLVTQLSQVAAMSRTVNIHEAKTHLSRLIRSVQAGEEVLIARRGEPVARLVRVESSGRRVLGCDRGAFTVPDDFNAPLDPSVLADFEA